MKKTKQRMAHRNIYTSLQQKSLKNVIKRELVLNFGYDNKLSVADLLADTLLALLEEYAPDREQVKPKQIVWTAVNRYDPPAQGKTIADTEQKTVMLDLWTEEEVDELAKGASPSKLFPSRVARVTKQALEQDALFNQCDLALIFNKSIPTIKKYIDYWQEETGEVLPLRGTIHDLGPTFTHKRQIIELHLKGYRCSKIAQITNHDPVNVDRYIGDFERVFEFAQEKAPIEKISLFTAMSFSLIKEYLSLIEEFNLLNKHAEGGTLHP